MTHPIQAPNTPSPAPRRHFLAQGLQLSAAAVALLGGRHALAARQPSDVAADVAILNSALAAEHQAIAAYQAGAESGLLRAATRDLALSFQGHHKAHAALLDKTVGQFGGTPAAPLARYAFPLDTLRAEADVLRFAAGLERDAVSAYLAAVPRFGNRDLAGAAASILGDEAMHWAVLRQALGEPPVPAAFVG
ncbi:MAG: ferritin-like domain-containing protein [Rhodocyclaceae bacterium]|nr:ferritin-like domain-containing protein [Rhodocyclaceae bacterium]